MTKSTKVGRPRSVGSREAILKAAFKLLMKEGYSGCAIEAVASLAGAGKTTIYRWWKSKAELTVDAFFFATEAELRFPNTGSAEGDFRAQITDLAELLRGPRGRVFAAMLVGSLNDPELSRTLKTKWLVPRRRWGIERMKRAKESKEVRDGVDIESALNVLYGPLYAPLLFGGDVPTLARIEAHLSVACFGVFVKKH